MWKRATVPVRLTGEQEARVLETGERVVPYPGARAGVWGATLPGLGRIQHTRPAFVGPRLRTVRVLVSDDGYCVEYTHRSVSSLATPLRLILFVLVVLVSSVGLAAATTRDHDWWTEAFSRLGVTGDLSSFAFNGGLVAVGLVSMVFAARLWMDLVRLRRYGAARSVAYWVPAACILASIGLIGVGLVPETSIRLLHDLSALTLVLALTVLMAAGPWLLRALPRRVKALAAGCAAVHFGCIAAFAVGLLTLAAFELLLFGVYFIWLVAISHAVHTKLNRRQQRRRRKLSPSW